MKRLFCVLLCLLLAFSLFACGKTAQPETPATTDPAAEPTAEPSTAPVSAAPTAEAAVFSLKTLPEIGAFVSDEKKAYFFDDGPHDNFEARDDYGEIVPYCVSEKYFAADWSYTDEETGAAFAKRFDLDPERYPDSITIIFPDGRCQTSYREDIQNASFEVIKVDRRKYWNEKGCRAFRRQLIATIREENIRGVTPDEMGKRI